ncbi:multiple epidermal growth factor-like domains 10, partial [Elysia marginata]
MGKAVLSTVEAVRLVVLLALPERIVVQNARLENTDPNVKAAAASTVLVQMMPVTMWMVNVTRAAMQDTLEGSVTKNVRLENTDPDVKNAAASTVVDHITPVTMWMVNVTRAAIQDTLEKSVAKNVQLENTDTCVAETAALAALAGIMHVIMWMVNVTTAVIKDTLDTSVTKVKCPLGKYGDECRSNCSNGCAGSYNACNHVNGKCDKGCDTGYIGDKCDR